MRTPSSKMSQASLSQLDYSAIGFSKTMTEEFEDLKKGQAELTQRLDVVLIWYYALVKQKQEAEAQSAKKTSAAALLSAATSAAASAATASAAETPAKTESSGEKTAEGGESSGSAKGGEVKIRRSVLASQYCETRADVIDTIQEWTTDASRTIVMFPSKRSADRTRRTIDFVNQTKVVLRKTKPIGEQENEEDAVWLGEWVTELNFVIVPKTTVATAINPAEIVPTALTVAIAESEVAVASPLRQVLTRAQMAISRKTPASFRHSTPETDTKEKSEKKKKAGKAKTKKAKYVTPLDLGVAEEKGEEGTMVLVTAAAPSHDDTISLAIENDAEMRQGKRWKKKQG